MVGVTKSAGTRRLADRQKRIPLLQLRQGTRKLPSWVPDDVIYNDTGRAYHYRQPLRTMANMRGSYADTALMTRLKHELQTAMYFSALDPSLLPVHIQKRRAQLLLEQLPLLNKFAPWYSRKDIDIPYRVHPMPVAPTKARTVGPFHAMPTNPGRGPPGHVETRRHNRETRPVAPGDATGQQGTAPNAKTRYQGIGVMGGGTS